MLCEGPTSREVSKIHQIYKIIKLYLIINFDIYTYIYKEVTTHICSYGVVSNLACLLSRKLIHQAEHFRAHGHILLCICVPGHPCVKGGCKQDVGRINM